MNIGFGDILLFVVSICTFISYIPQIIEIVVTKEAENLSITTWIIWVMSQVCYIAYAIFYQSTFLLLFEAVLEGVLMVIVLTLSIKYRDNDKQRELKQIEQENKQQTKE